MKKVEYSADERSILVSFSTGKQQRLYLPYDTELFPRLMELGVEVDFERANLLATFLEGVARVRSAEGYRGVPAEYSG